MGIGIQLFQRLALPARKQSSDEPCRLAHLDDHDEGAILIEGKMGAGAPKRGGQA